MVEDLIQDWFQLSETSVIVDIISGNSLERYSITFVWSQELEKWEGFSCTCKGWKNRGSCRHLNLDLSSLKLKKPSKQPIPRLVDDGSGWYFCEICKCKTFYIKQTIPLKGGKRNFEHSIANCTKCGRQYTL